jgi:hypothetical protein
MLFYSPHANYQVICSKTRIKYHPVTGDEIDRVTGVWANFGKLGPQYEYSNPETGEMMTGAAISGHYFDTDLEAAQNGWAPEIKEMVERKLLALCERQPDQIRLEQREIARAVAPWPTYDAATADQVVTLAVQLGLVEETLAYERENRDRPDVIDGLTAAQDMTEEPAEEPAKAPKLDKAKVEELSRTITV